MSSLRSLHLSVFALTAYLILASASLTDHPIDQCFDHEFSTFNASAIAHFPPLSQNITNPTLATWKIGTAVKEVFPAGGNTSFIKQKWWLEGDSTLPSDASVAPIEGCIVLLQANPNNTLLSKGVDNSTSQNGCANIMKPDCQNAMVSWVTQNITTYSDTDLDNHWTICPKIAHLINDLPKECEAAYKFDTIPLQPFGNPEFIAPSENGCDNNDFNIFEGSAIQNTFLELPSNPTPLKDHTKYDEIVGMTNPFLLVSWPRNRTQRWTADAQIVCLTPSEDITRGSRVPGSSPGNDASDGKKNAASAAVHGESLFALWILLLVVSLMA